MTSWIVLLLVGGTLLILAEFVLPGMICGVIGSVMVVGGMYLSAREYPELALPILTGELFGVAFVLIGGLYFISRTGAFIGLTLKTAQDVDEGYVSVPTNESLLGKTGRALTTLRPSGTIEIEGQRMDAVSAGVYVEKDSPVRIVEVRGNRVVVEPEMENEA